MENEKFSITFDEDTGGIKSIVNPNDEHSMNWCLEGCIWGLIRSKNRYFNWDNGRRLIEDLPTLESFTQTDSGATSIYSNGMLRITVERFFRTNGNFTERYTIENMRDTDVFIGQDNFGITTPFNDRYASADECMVHHCNAHVWCGYNTSYVNALRMGISDINLGLALTQGRLDSYSIEGCDSNVRGTIVLNSGFFTLVSGGRYVIEWELFWHTGNDDFYTRLQEYPNTIYIKAANYTVYKGEPIEFVATHYNGFKNATVMCNNREIEYLCVDDKLSVRFLPENTGEYRFEIIVDDVSTYAEFIVVKPLMELIENRLNVIVNTQQYINEDSPLHGAFLIYDFKERHPVFDDSFGDHNACRERVGMALLLARYLQLKENVKFEKALDLYIEFVKREFYDEETGFVHNSINKTMEGVRLYNAPWIMMLFAEMYLLKKDTYYTDQIVKIAKWYYSNGGSKFYPNALSFEKLMVALRHSNNPEADEMFELFRGHVENIINIGTSYPPHEVTYEQTIVTPAVTLISNMGMLTGDVRYIEEAKKHMVNLERFNGHQPSFHLYEIPIRYWDDYWFGKSEMFGDTFPHYWSCLTAHSFMSYYKISGDNNYFVAADRCMRNCMCLFTDDGLGSCAYMYPYSIDGRRGQFYDEWENDQDFALYIAIEG